MLTSILLATAALSITGTLANYTPHYGPCQTPFTPYKYVGCYNDPAGNTLPFNPGVDGSNMTIEYCQAACKGNGFRYAGLEYYGQCRCGADIEGTLNTPTGGVTDSCSYACTGNPNEICGGSNLISIYQDPTYPPFDATIAGTQYASLGCYTEVDGRALSTPQDDIYGSTMTLEICLNRCGTEGYAFAAVEYGQECYCGGILAPDSVAAPATDCNMPCAGNSAETCGGTNRLNLYYNKNLDSNAVCGASSSSTPIASTPVATSGTTFTTAISVVPSTISTQQPSYTLPSSSATGTTVSVPSVSTPVSTPATTPKTPVSTSQASTPISTAPATSQSSAASTPASTPATSKPSSAATTAPASSTLTRTSTLPPATTSSTCRRTCGKYCAPPLPTYTEPSGCNTAATTCWNQLKSCYAANPGSVLLCDVMAAECAIMRAYCNNKCTSGNCGPSSCSAWVPKVPVTSAAPVVPTYVPPATPAPALPSVGVCFVPSAYQAAVGGYAAPVVSCNNNLYDFQSNNNQFKCYNSQKTGISPTYSRNQVSQACQASCQMQYDNCRTNYAPTCTAPRLARRNPDAHIEARTFWWFFPWFTGGSTDSYNGAINKCLAQKNACMAVNQWVSAANSCKHFATPQCAPGW